MMMMHKLILALCLSAPGGMSRRVLNMTMAEELLDDREAIKIAVTAENEADAELLAVQARVQPHPASAKRVAADRERRKSEAARRVMSRERRESEEEERVKAVYKPCEGKRDGETCTLCAPVDSNCVETTVSKTCLFGECQSGKVLVRVPSNWTPDQNMLHFRIQNVPYDIDVSEYPLIPGALLPVPLAAPDNRAEERQTFHPLPEKMGVEFEPLKGVISNVIPGSLADKAGVKKGWTMLNVGGEKPNDYLIALQELKSGKSDFIVTFATNTAEAHQAIVVEAVVVKDEVMHPALPPATAEAKPQS